jgi:hypothetical protein
MEGSSCNEPASPATGSTVIKNFYKIIFGKNKGHCCKAEQKGKYNVSLTTG